MRQTGWPESETLAGNAPGAPASGWDMVVFVCGVLSTRSAWVMWITVLRGSG
jgi:hypothetical protein